MDDDEAVGYAETGGNITAIPGRLTLCHFGDLKVGCINVCLKTGACTLGCESATPAPKLLVYEIPVYEIPVCKLASYSRTRTWPKERSFIFNFKRRTQVTAH